MQRETAWRSQRIPGAIRLALRETGRTARDSKPPLELFEAEEDQCILEEFASSLLASAANGAVNSAIDARTDEYKAREKSVRERLNDATCIIVYAEDARNPTAEVMVKRLSQMGYDSVVLLKGGLAAWQRAGRAVDTSTIPAQ